MIHPQGTVLGEADRPWRRGAARVAMEAGVPLVPVALVFTERVLRPAARPHRVPCRSPCSSASRSPVGPPSEPDEARATALTERVRRAVEELRAPYYGRDAGLSRSAGRARVGRGRGRTDITPGGTLA